MLVLLCLTLRVTYDERGRSVHADDGAINPAKKPLHYQLNVASGWTLHRQNHLRHKHQPTHTDPVHPQHYHNFLPVLWGLFCFEILCPEVSLSVLLSGVERTFFCGAHSFESRFLKIQQLLETLFQLLWINNKDVFSRTNLQTTAETICLLNFGWFDRNQQLLW